MIKELKKALLEAETSTKAPEDTLEALKMQIRAILASVEGAKPHPTDVETAQNTILRIRRELFGIAGAGLPGGIISSGDDRLIASKFREIIGQYEIITDFPR